MINKKSLCKLLALLLSLTLMMATAVTAFADNSYTVIFFDEGSGTTYGMISVTSGKTIGNLMINDPEKSGYTFTGWVDSNGDSISADTVVEKNFIAYATWTQNAATSYTVIFFDEGSGTTYGMISVTSGNAISNLMISDPEKSGFTFTGWVDSNGNPITAATIVEKNTVAYATWTQNAATSYTVIFFDEGSGTTYGTISVTSGEVIGNLMISDPTKSGYTFTGWVDSNGDPISADTVVEKNFIAYASWEEDKPTTDTTSSVDGVIYINESYHGILVTQDGRTHILSVAHTVDDNGYCTVCKAYIGTDGGVATTTINGGEYVEAYYAEVGINSENDSRWGSKDLGGTELIEALAQDGAILVITRDGVSDTVFSDDGDFEKFGLVNAWWTGDGWVALGTAGHTSADEEGVVDCLSDDGTTVIYDGATVYAAWQALNLNTGSNTTIISNTSNSLSIVSVAVYVPADAVSVEEVEVSDPQESGETDSEDDGEDLTVDDSEPETPAETNPTTGAVLALVPMAIAGLAVVASKRR